jgi:hypothetical protein
MRILIETDPGRGGWQLVGRIVVLVLVIAVLILLGGYLLLREAERIAPLIPKPATVTDMTTLPQSESLILEQRGAAGTQRRAP